MKFKDVITSSLECFRVHVIQWMRSQYIRFLYTHDLHHELCTAKGSPGINSIISKVCRELVGTLLISRYRRQDPCHIAIASKPTLLQPGG